MTYKRKEVFGDITLYQGDCLEIMPTLGKVDAVVTDPPYGIGADKGKNGGEIPFKGGKPVKLAHYPDNRWDDVRPTKAHILTFVNKAKHSIVWGGNYFADLLPAQGRWLWWDKCQTMPSYGDGELAWTNLPQKTPKKFTYANNKLLANRVARHHPTQKPLPLMKWCIELLPDAQIILDPYMGSGTTLVACQEMGLMGVGIEKEPDYFDIACKRVEEAQKQPDLFIEQQKEAPPEQLNMEVSNAQ